MAEAQQTGRIARIGYLDGGTAAGSVGLLEAFRQQLNKLDWVEGKNLAIEYRFADGKIEKLQELAAELVRLKVDAMVTAATSGAWAAKQATTSIPIIMASGGDPVAAGVIPSLARPGGNITGVSTLSPDLAGKRLEFLKEVVPYATRVGVVTSGAAQGNVKTGAPLQFNNLKAVAERLELKLQEIKFTSSPTAAENAFQTAVRERVDAIIASSTPYLFAARKRIVELAAKYRLPAIYPLSEYSDEGGLMAYGANRRDLYKRAAIYVDKVLRGANPGDLPIDRATKFELAINLKTAMALELIIPSQVLMEADKVIK
jgi:putative ABC transport system substrate-binding protein